MKIFIPLLFMVLTLNLNGNIMFIAEQNGNYYYISSAPRTVTRYELATSLAFLAHNSSEFSLLLIGDAVTYGNQVYYVTEISRYKILNSDYVNEDGKVYTDTELWSLYYARSDVLVLQTCIPNGRLFVLAEKDKSIERR